MSFRKFGGISLASKSYNNNNNNNSNSNNNNNNSNNSNSNNNLIPTIIYPTLSNDSEGYLNIEGDLTVNGNINCSNDIVIFGSITSGSDYRLKENIMDLSLSKFTIDNLRPIYFQYKDSKKESIGLIAHEIQNEIPFLVEGEKNGESLQSVNYLGLSGLLLKELQEFKKQLNIVNIELIHLKNK